MLKYFISIVVCCLVLFIGVVAEKKIESRINEVAGWRSDLLLISFFILVVTDGIAIIYFAVKFFSFLA